MIVQCRGGGGAGEERVIILYIGLRGGLLRERSNGVWVLIERKTAVDHRVTLEDADSPYLPDFFKFFHDFLSVIPDLLISSSQ